jgi:hypothetical protein
LKIVDHLQNATKHLTWHGHLGHLKDGVPPLGNDLGADLDQLLARAEVSDQRSISSGRARVRKTLAML